MKFIKKTDFLIAVGLIVISLAAWAIYREIKKEDSVTAEIYLDSELVETVELEKGEERYFSIDGKPNVVFHITEEGRIAFVESDCPDKVCIQTGYIYMPGQFAACLPNGIVMKIKGNVSGEDQPDLILGTSGME